jgi:hypothetical protein
VAPYETLPRSARAASPTATVATDRVEAGAYLGAWTPDPRATQEPGRSKSSLPPRTAR